MAGDPRKRRGSGAIQSKRRAQEGVVRDDSWNMLTIKTPTTQQSGRTCPCGMHKNQFGSTKEFNDHLLVCKPEELCPL